MARELAPGGSRSAEGDALCGDGELLVVDGYNVIHKSARYLELIDEADGGDPFERARTKLIGDVASFAQHRYDAVVVFDAAENLSSQRPNLSQAGIRVLFSEAGQSADAVIERLVTNARLQARSVTVVTSDNTIRATVGGVPVTRLSSDVLVREMDAMDADVTQELKELPASDGRESPRLGDAREARPPARPSVAVMWRGVAAYVDLRVVKKKSGAATQKTLS